MSMAGARLVRILGRLADEILEDAPAARNDALSERLVDPGEDSAGSCPVEHRRTGTKFTDAETGSPSTFAGTPPEGALLRPLRLRARLTAALRTQAVPVLFSPSPLTLTLACERYMALHGATPHSGCGGAGVGIDGRAVRAARLAVGRLLRSRASGARVRRR